MGGLRPDGDVVAQDGLVAAADEVAVLIARVVGEGAGMAGGGMVEIAAPGARKMPSISAPLPRL